MLGDYKLNNTGKILRIVEDESPRNPNQDDSDFAFLVYDHRQFQVDVEDFKPIDIFHNQINNIYGNYFIFMVYAHIHSGIVLSLTGNNYPFIDGWDTSSTGYILISKKDTTRDDAYNIAVSMIKTWNQYLSGEVYGYRIIQQTTCSECGTVHETEENSCYGFYGTNIFNNGLTDSACFQEELDFLISNYTEMKKLFDNINTKTKD